MTRINRQDALAYHSDGRKGKIQVVPTKATATQRDLSLAYSPGVAEPCLAIEQNPLDSYRYTARGNLVAVVTNGSAVLGLGDVGPLASKPVMEGKSVLFKRFADIDVFDLEIDTRNVDDFVRFVKLLQPTVGGVHLEDLRAPECFEIERRLEEELNIPVFHDDQHGTAIISAAALLNALEIAGKKISEVRLVVSGSGAAAIASLNLYFELGLQPANALLCDSKGVIYRGRTERMDRIKEPFAAETNARTLADAMRGADVFVGLSVGGLVTPEMLASMAPNPIVFALANPSPEIDWDEAHSSRPDVIMATGRSDYSNQVNNMLGFPFIFRGALDVRATDINEGMKLAAVHALAALAREDVPDSVLKAYGLDSLQFGREYLLPKPFDHRVLLRVAPAVARAAMDGGVAQIPIEDFEAYRRQLESLISRRLELMHTIIDRAQREPRRVVFPEGEHDQILRASKILVDQGIAHPILLARRNVIAEKLDQLDLSESDLTILHHEESEEFERYSKVLHNRRWRDGVTLSDAQHLMRSRTYFASMMVDMDDADGLIAGLTHNFNETIRYALQVVGLEPGVNRACGTHILLLEHRILFLADTMVNIDPSPEELAEMAILTAQLAQSFGIEPRVAMLSFSNFGSNSHPAARKVRQAVSIAQKIDPGLMIDGEMRGETALHRTVLDQFPQSQLREPANVLIFPELQSANIAFDLLHRLTSAEAIGPILLGLERPVHVLDRGAEVADIVNMTAICVVGAQEAKEARGQRRTQNRPRG